MSCRKKHSSRSPRSIHDIYWGFSDIPEQYWPINSSPTEEVAAPTTDPENSIELPSEHVDIFAHYWDFWGFPDIPEGPYNPNPTKSPTATTTPITTLTHVRTSTPPPTPSPATTALNQGPITAYPHATYPATTSEPPTSSTLPTSTIASAVKSTTRTSTAKIAASTSGKAKTTASQWKPTTYTAYTKASSLAQPMVKVEFKLERPFTPDLLNHSSPAYHSLSTTLSTTVK